jgi:hypothetical protein
VRLHELPAPLTRETIAAHHRDDYFMHHVAVAARAPYTMTVARALALRIFRTGDYRRFTDVYFDRNHRSGSGVLARRLIDRLVQIASGRGARVLVVLMAHPNQTNLDSAEYDSFAADLRRRGSICVADTKPHLRDRARALGGTLPTAPRGHHDAAGHRLIAEDVLAQLRTCGIAP